MRCPVDDAELNLLPKVPGLAESCPACGGLWLEAKSLRHFEAILPSGPLTTDPADARRCSRCEVHMDRLRLPQVEIDLCPDCRGVWLDAGELETVQQLRRRPDAGAGVVTAGEVVEFVFELAGMLFELFG